MDEVGWKGICGLGTVDLWRKGDRSATRRGEDEAERKSSATSSSFNSRAWTYLGVHSVDLILRGCSEDLDDIDELVQRAADRRGNEVREREDPRRKESWELTSLQQTWVDQDRLRRAHKQKTRYLKRPREDEKRSDGS